MRFFTSQLAHLPLLVMVLATTPALSQDKSAPSPDRARALKKQIEQFLAATKSKDTDKITELTRNMKLTKPSAFFASVFDAENAKRLTTEFGRLAAAYDVEFPKLFVEMVKRNRTEVTVLQHTRPNPKATGNQNKTLKAMKTPVPLYSVRFVEPGKRLGTHVHNFVYFDGNFRLAGGMRNITAPTSPQALALKKQLTAVLAASRKAGPGTLTPELKALTLPNHKQWFLKTFGPEHGPKLAASYSDGLKQFDTQLPALFTDLIKRGRTEIRILRFTSPTPEAVGNQRYALKAMIKPTPLYSARFVEPGKPRGLHLYSFVEIDGSFHLAGKMRGLPAD